MYTYHKLFIGGSWVDASGSEVFDVVSPSTESKIGQVPAAMPADVDRAVAAAKTSFEDGPWRNTSPEDRAGLIEHSADLLEQRAQSLVELMIGEVGSIRADTEASQVGAAIATMRSAAEWCRRFPFEEKLTEAQTDSLIIHEPVGIVASIIPWNAPLTIGARTVASALAAGCAVILKTAPEAPLSSNVLADVFVEAGLPSGVLSVIPADRQTSEYLVRHPGVDKVTFTGSAAAGARVASICGEQFTRVNLELGGKSAAIVLDDAELAEVVPKVLRMAFRLNGQACVSMSRVLVPRIQADAYGEALASAIGNLTTGDPFASDSDIGPLKTAAQRDRVEGYVRIGLEEGAKLAVGGGRPTHLQRGWYVEPALFVDASNSMRIAREEIFGPVLTLIPYGSTDEAVAIANDSEYGLSGSVWTPDVERGVSIARQIRTGSVLVNGARRSLATPFGGFKRSGIGRESGREGIRSFTELKSISVPLAGTDTGMAETD